jgi:hypothetical protein
VQQNTEKLHTILTLTKVTGVAHEPGAFTPYESLERMLDEPPRLSG